MSDIIKIIGIGFVTLIVTLILKEYKKDFAIYASLIGGMLIIFLMINYLESIVSFISGLSESNNEFILLLIKITGISILTEFATSVCRDSGESSIASKVDLGGKIIVISMSIPVISATLKGLLGLLE